MSKHTPGPWEQIIDGDMVGAMNPYGHGMMNIADIRGWGHLTGTGACRLSEKDAIAIQEANARLIASAPELLDVLKDLLYDLDTVDSHALNETVLPIWEDIDRAKAIIAKAEGTP
jgi:hypothetical protein